MIDNDNVIDVFDHNYHDEYNNDNDNDPGEAREPWSEHGEGGLLFNLRHHHLLQQGQGPVQVMRGACRGRQELSEEDHGAGE